MRTRGSKSGKAETAGRTGPGADLQAVYRLQAEMCRVLGHPERLAIIDLLGEGELPTSELLRRLCISKVNLSRHLTLLKQAGLVESRLQGREALYRLTFNEIKSACSIIREVLALRLRQNARLVRSLSFSQAGPAAG